jgi:hypothetical protein
MTEAEVERYFTWAVRRAGGQTYKFRSPTHSGVADRIACLPNGETWFVEIKKIGGRISPLQHMFAEDMHRLHQNYACLWSKEEIDQWLP